MEQLKKVVGLADLCELMKRAFSFPDEELAQALVLGAFSEDLRSCLQDAGAPEEMFRCVDVVSEVFLNQECETVHEALRRDFTFLYLIPGEDVSVFPYESAFRIVETSEKGKPSLFGSAVAKDVEAHMREAGVVPKNIRKEPVDSVWNEFEFFSYLYGNRASALQLEDYAHEQVWRERIKKFYEEHGSQWLTLFMEHTKRSATEKARGIEYPILAECGLVVAELIKNDALAQ